MGNPIIQPILSPPVGPIMAGNEAFYLNYQTMNGKPGTT